MSFLSLQNYVLDSHPKPFDPEKDTIPVLPEEIEEKGQKRLWEQSNSHLYVTLNVGAIHAKRISAENPIFSCTGIAVDYDNQTAWGMASTGDPWKNLDKPTWISKSFSGGVHAYYLFEQPVVVLNPDIWERFIKILSKRLKLKAVLPGLDEQSLKNPAMFYDVGSQWTKFGDLLPISITSGPLAEAFVKGSVSTPGGLEYPIFPIAEVAKQVEIQYPGRWQGEFKLGARGCRFWDPDADAESCIVKPEGMICFTGDSKFVPWSAIFDRKFVDFHTSDRVGAAIENFWYDSSNYYYFERHTQKYRRMDKGDVRLALACEYNLNKSVPRGGGNSEVDIALSRINKAKWVQRAGPCVSRPHGIITLAGERMLNTCTTKTAQPILENVTNDDFPWIWNFISNFFDPAEQLIPFLAWLQIAYMNQLYRKEVYIGHVLFLAGPKDQGKTFFSNGLVSALLGGHEDAEDYLLGKTQFNGTLFHKPLWVVDDAHLGSAAMKMEYSNILKKVGANELFTYNQKFENSCQVEWKGRVMISCNLDADSIRTIPNLDINNDTKLSIFQVSLSTAEKRGFNQNFREIFMNELPYFAKWLLEWKRPPELDAGDSRYRIKNYINPALKEIAVASSENMQLLEIISTFLKEYFDQHPDKQAWIGKSSILFGQMSECVSVKAALLKSTPEMLARKLSKQISSGDPNFQSAIDEKNQTIYRISKRICQSNPDHIKWKEEQEETKVK
jgi:hypothetical protein